MTSSLSSEQFVGRFHRSSYSERKALGVQLGFYPLKIARGTLKMEHLFEGVLHISKPGRGGTLGNLPPDHCPVDIKRHLTLLF